MLTQDICTLHNAIALYNSYGGIVFAAEEGRNIAAALGPLNKVCLPPISFTILLQTSIRIPKTRK